MIWPALGEESAVCTTILGDTTAAKRCAQHWAREEEAKIGAGVWMWWTDGSRSEDGRVGAAAVCKHGNQWRSCRIFLGMGRMEVFDAELWAIGLALGLTIKESKTLQRHGVQTVAVFRDWQTGIRQAAHIAPCAGQLLPGWINRRERRRSLPKSSQPRFTVSSDSPASLEMMRRTVRQTRPERPAETL